MCGFHTRRLPIMTPAMISLSHSRPHQQDIGSDEQYDHQYRCYFRKYPERRIFGEAPKNIPDNEYHAGGEKHTQQDENSESHHVRF